MSDILIRTEGRAGRIILTRPKALNALNYDMCMAIDKALIDWADDPAVALVVIDAEGERAFCAGGDIAEMYATGTKGDYGYGRRFWRDEYRMNARIAGYGKPVVSFLHGFVMGGGVGIGCHGSHRVVGDTSRIAMPECGIGLIPDVGGTLILARAPGRLGHYVGLTGAQIGAGDAIHTGFADHYLPEAGWPALIADLCASGDAGLVAARAMAAPESPLAAAQADIDAVFGAGTGGPVDVVALLSALEGREEGWATAAHKAIGRNSPLSMACTDALIRALGPGDGIREALAQEFRFTFRSMEHGDFLEGVRAQIIDKDRNPRWKHTIGGLAGDEAAAMLAPLGPDELTF